MLPLHYATPLGCDGNRTRTSGTFHFPARQALGAGGAACVPNSEISCRISGSKVGIAATSFWRIAARPWRIWPLAS